jgi:hypothetical protein
MFEGLSEPTIRAFAARANKLLPGVYAWAATVALPATAPEVSQLGRVLAFLALVALVLGPWLSPLRPALGRLLGIHAFVGLSLATWALALRSGTNLAPEPLRAALGGLGWMAYAFGWGDLGRPLRVPEDDPAVLGGPPLPPRAELPRRATIVFGIGLAGALLLVALAWRVGRTPQTVMAHAVALAAGLWLLAATTEVSLTPALRAKGSASERLSRASGTLCALVIVLGLGLLWMVLGR